MNNEEFRSESVSNEADNIEAEIKESEEKEEITAKEEVAAKETLDFFGKILTRSTVATVKAMNKKNKMDNVAIFIDYDNVYWTLMNNYNHDPNHEEDEKNLFVQLWKRYGQANVRTFRAYADFEKIKTQLTSLQKKRVQIRHVYSNGKEGDFRKNSSDIELCIDAIEHTYKDPNVTCYVFVTADSDMIPIISRMTYKSKQVELFYLSKSSPKHIDITSFANYSADLLDFLNVDVKEFKIDSLILDTLKIISDWHYSFKDKNFFLGTSFLKKEIVKKLSIPLNIASEILEKLSVDDLIYDGVKEMDDGTRKTSIMLTEKSTEILDKHFHHYKEVAATATKK